MAGKAKFDQEAAFKSIIGADRRPVEKQQEETEKPKRSRQDLCANLFAGSG